MSRKLTLAICFAVHCVPFVRHALANSEPIEKPNFIVILCDDLGYADIGPFGSEHHSTPNLDRMANEGMRLTSFYSTCGVCTPSRASLMTGCYPKRIGMHENEKGQWVLFPGNQRGLSPNEVTIAEVLKQQGYATAIIDGKDVSPILLGDSGTSPHEQFYYYFQGQLSAVRSEDWKLFVKRRPRRNQPATLAEALEQHLANFRGAVVVSVGQE